MARVFTIKGYCGTEGCVGRGLAVEITSLGGPKIELAAPFSDFEDAWRMSNTLLSATRYAPVEVYTATNREQVSTEIFAGELFFYPMHDRWARHSESQQTLLYPLPGRHREMLYWLLGRTYSNNVKTR
jgi:hypothetical protein